MNGYEAVQHWLDGLLSQGNLPAEVAAIGFNLYERGQDSWSMEMVGTSRFSLKDESWIDDRVGTFSADKQPLVWTQTSDWKTILAEAVLNLREYLNSGHYANQLKTVAGIGIGFADGELEILYTST